MKYLALLFLSLVPFHLFAQDLGEKITCKESATGQEVAEVLLALTHDSISSTVSLIRHITHKRGPLKNGNFRTKYGFIIHSNCLAQKGVTVESVEKSIDEMLSTVKGCGNRMSLYIQGLFNGALSDGSTLTCDFGPTACSGSKKAAACYNQESNSINFMKVEHLHSPSTLFHELLHQAGVDNQSVDCHNDSELGSDNRLNDEVYFWQDVCFSPESMLYQVRNEFPDQKVCERALRYSNKPNRIKHGPESIDRVCGYYHRYVAQERKLQSQVVNGLFAPAFTCELEDCRYLDSARKKLKAGGKDGLVLPPISKMVKWAQKHGYFYNSEDEQAPWAAVHYYLMKLEPKPEELEKQGLTPDEARNYAAYLQQVQKKVAFLTHITDFDRIQRAAKEGRQEAKRFLADAFDECRDPQKVGGTKMCKEFEKSTAATLGKLLSAWK